jgi:HD-like signal output (HDOD) protein
MIEWFALLIGIAGIAGLMYCARRLVESRSPSYAGAGTAVHVAESAQASDDGSPVFESEAVSAVQATTYQLAFGVRRFDYQIFADHQRVLDEVAKSFDAPMPDQRHFPRRPALLPKLLRVINDDDSTREAVVRLILPDPVLAGNVLKRANSVFYQQTEPVESVERAIVVLGSDGLRAPVAAAVLQPVFQLPRGFFEQFAPMTWEQARRSAFAAETYARIHKAGDPFTAHLIGLLGGLGRIVIFRATLDQYRRRGNLMPRAEVFIRLMMDQGRKVTHQIATSWQMSESFLGAMEAQIARQSPAKMPSLARALYFGELCGALALLEQHQQRTRDEAISLLTAQGLDNESCLQLLSAANTSDQ